jgi:cephalosporin hydroxylase
MDYIDRYHILYEKAKIWEKNSWFGIPAWKLPMDMMIIQELIVRIKPRYIIETGTGHGGSAMFYASICELLGEGEIITVDIDLTKRVSNKWGNFEWEDRINFVHGGSTNPRVFDKIKKIIGKAKRNMVILDSYHTKEHVKKEMALYSPLVSVGSYMIVEDTHANGHPVPWEYDNDGPYEAVEDWLKFHGEYWEADYECEKHLLTFNPIGYLKRIK